MAECREICNKTVDCIAFTYELKLGFCSLKNAQPYKRESICTIPDYQLVDPTESVVLTLARPAET